jgi:hypothetical protein
MPSTDSEPRRPPIPALRKNWTPWPGTAGRHALERVDGIHRNRWSAWPGLCSSAIRPICTSCLAICADWLASCSFAARCSSRSERTMYTRVAIVSNDTRDALPSTLISQVEGRDPCVIRMLPHSAIALLCLPSGGAERLGMSDGNFHPLRLNQAFAVSPSGGWAVLWKLIVSERKGFPGQLRQGCHYRRLSHLCLRGSACHLVPMRQGLVRCILSLALRLRQK